MKQGEGASAVDLDEVFPWGRCFEEYRDMFALTKDDLEKRILGCGDGPSSFNCTVTQHGGEVVSFDPIYEASEQELHARIDATFDNLMEQVHENRDRFVWRNLRDVEDLGPLPSKFLNPAPFLDPCCKVAALRCHSGPGSRP